MSDVVYRKEEPEKFLRAWSMLAKSSMAGPRATPVALQYRFALAEERGLTDDRSFVLCKNDEPIAAALLPIGTIEGERAVTMGGEYTDAPLVKNAAVREEVFRLIDTAAHQAGAEKALMALDPLDNEPSNYLPNFGYLDTSLISYIYDLSGMEPFLSRMRRNHARSLKEILGDPRFTVIRIDAQHPDRIHHKKYEELHEKCSGRKTRSTRTFDLQYEQLLAGEAVLFGVLMEGKAVAYGYFEHADGKALYASTSDDPEVQGYPLNHLLTYSALEYYRAQGFKSLLPGEPSCPSPQFDYWPDEKQLGIAHFKKGFPGEYRPYYRGIRYYTSVAAEKDAKRFAEGYVRSLRAYQHVHHE